MLVGFFWYGINTYNGALCVDAVIVAIWPSFKDVPNSLPESANITTQMMTGECPIVASLAHADVNSLRGLLSDRPTIPLHPSSLSEMVLRRENNHLPARCVCTARLGVSNQRWRAPHRADGTQYIFERIHVLVGVPGRRECESIVNICVAGSDNG